MISIKKTVPKYFVNSLDEKHLQVNKLRYRHFACLFCDISVSDCALKINRSSSVHIQKR